jgi:hypothetical protein
MNLTPAQLFMPPKSQFVAEATQSYQKVAWTIPPKSSWA